MAIDQAPQAGSAMTAVECDALYQKFLTRQLDFPDEGEAVSFNVVILNSGDQYTSITCLNGEWTGIKGEIVAPEPPDVALCPNGHNLLEGFGLSVGWVNRPLTMPTTLTSSTNPVVVIEKPPDTPELPPPSLPPPYIPTTA